MINGLQSSKQALRSEVGNRLKGMGSPERATASSKVCELLGRQPRWRAAKSILFFAPLAEEVNVWPLLEQALAAGKIVALPRFDSLTACYGICRVENLARDIAVGRYGIREPVEQCVSYPLNRLDFVLTPGVAFDLRGRRLGRGKGYYDRLLASVRGTMCGVAFDEQIVQEIPIEPHDVHLNCIVTPSRWIEL
ncbi:MAG TPA: 5-formyltetrahydrofolate cyclo-ligase [Clostridia bacterium]|nr:5-formyltetrahydrofolate cyclo-ligase [Clostridia bacterium]